MPQQKQNITEIESTIITAIVEGKKELVETQLRDNQQKTTGKSDLVRALQIAVEMGKHKFVELLLKYGAKTEFKNALGETESTLCNAIKYKNYQCLETMLQHGADPNVQNQPFGVAISENDITAYNILLKHGLDIHQHKDRNLTLAVIHTNAKTQNKFIRILLEIGANPTKTTEDSTLCALALATKKDMQIILKHCRAKNKEEAIAIAQMSKQKVPVETAQWLTQQMLCLQDSKA